MTRTVRINRDRLWTSLMELKQIGAYDDDATGLRGVRRLALTDADAEARRRCPAWMLQAWQRLTIWGEAAHAGTTPIASRHGAGLVAASVEVEARRMCDSGDFGQLRATVGTFDIGAGHDAQEISTICPTAMVFVAGENGGISHTPREYSNPGACANGTDVLANAVLRLADQP